MCVRDVIDCGSTTDLSDLCDSAGSDVTNVTFPATLGGYSVTSTTFCGEDTSHTSIKNFLSSMSYELK